MLDSQGDLDVEVIHLIDVDGSIRLRQDSVLCPLLGPDGFQRKPGDPGCGRTRALPSFNEACMMPQLAEACVQHRLLARDVPQTLLEA